MSWDPYRRYGHHRRGRESRSKLVIGVDTNGATRCRTTLLKIDGMKATHKPDRVP